MLAHRLSILAIAAMLGAGAALADDLNLGGNYNTFTIDENGSPVSTGGGPITPSTLDGRSLAWVYCVGLFTTVNVPADYPYTVVTTNGVADGAAINNAGEIAWLLDHYAAGAVGNTIDQEALQAAIWSVEYDSTSLGHPVVTGNSGQSYYSQYESDLAALGSNTDPVSDILWLTPETTAGQDVNQALVAPVPEPASILLLGTMVLLIGLSIKRKKLAAR